MFIKLFPLAGYTLHRENYPLLYFIAIQDKIKYFYSLTGVVKSIIASQSTSILLNESNQLSSDQLMHQLMSCNSKEAGWISDCVYTVF